MLLKINNKGVRILCTVNILGPHKNLNQTSSKTKRTESLFTQASQQHTYAQTQAHSEKKIPNKYFKCTVNIVNKTCIHFHFLVRLTLQITLTVLAKDISNYP